MTNNHQPRSFTTSSRIRSAIVALLITGNSTAPVLVKKLPAFCSASNPIPLTETSFTTTASTPLPASFARPLANASSVSAANPTTMVPGTRCATTSRRISCSLKLEDHRSRRLALDLLCRDAPHTIITHRCRHHDDRGLAQPLHHGGSHLVGGDDPHNLTPRRLVQASGSADKNHARTTTPRGIRNGIPHPSARAIPDKPHRIDRLARSSRRHQHRLAGKVR